MHYHNYHAEDFLSDDSFQKYCLGTDVDATLFWQQWIKNNPEKLAEIEQAKQLYYLLNGNNTAGQFESDEQKFSAAITQLVNEKKVSRKKGIIRWIMIPAAAASVLVATLLIIKRPSKNYAENILVTGAGEHKFIQLPDGSKVTLNEKSTLRVAKGFNDENRDITLSGEAFFDVTQNASKPFIIHTPHSDINVLGTVLNVKAYPEELFMETSLLKGSVEVILKKRDHKRILLKPNEKISINYGTSKDMDNRIHVTQNKLHLSQNSLAAVSGNQQDSSFIHLLWSTGTLTFNKSNFEEIALQLQQWYGVDINFEDDAVKQYRFTGDFKDKGIMEVLNALQLSRHFNYEIDKDNSILIKE